MAIKQVREKKGKVEEIEFFFKKKEIEAGDDASEGGGKRLIPLCPSFAVQFHPPGGGDDEDGHFSCQVKRKYK